MSSPKKNGLAYICLLWLLSGCAAVTTIQSSSFTDAPIIAHDRAPRTHEFLVIDEITLISRDIGGEEVKNAAAEWVELKVVAAIRDSGRYPQVYGPRAADLAPDGGVHARLEIISTVNRHSARNAFSFLFGSVTVFLSHTVFPLRFDLSQDVVLEITPNRGAPPLRFRSSVSATRTCYIQAHGAIDNLFGVTLATNLQYLTTVVQRAVTPLG